MWELRVILSYRGLTYYKDLKNDKKVVGLMHTVLGGYKISDIEVVAAFDVNKTKVGKDLAEAIYANQIIRMCLQK